MTKKALTLALEALEIEQAALAYEHGKVEHIENAITAIKEALAQPEQEKERCVGCEACIDTACGRDECPKGWPKPAQPEQEPVAMKFKIYKPTVPDPTRQDINNALLPWVYDQDRSSGFDASMWVTPVSTLPPQRKPLTDEEIGAILEGVNAYGTRLYTFARAIEAKLKEKNSLLALPVVTLPLEIK